MGVVHVVVAPLAPADPLLRVRVVRVRRGVVVPGRQVDHRPLRQHRRRVLGVDVVDVPVEVEAPDVTEHLHPAVRMDRLHRHRRSADVHVRLVVLDPRRERQRRVGVVDRLLPRRKVERLHRLPRPEHLRVDAVLRREPCRVEPEPDLGPVGDLLADRVVMDVVADPGARLQQLPGVLPEHVAVLPDGELGEERAPTREVDGRREVVRLLLLDDPRKGVVDDPPAPNRRPDLDAAHPPVLGQAGLDERLVPLVLPCGRLRPGRRDDDQIGVAAHPPGEAPDVAARPGGRRRQVGRVAARGAGVDPGDDGGDLRVGQRDVVRERLDADRPVDVPGGHLARRHLPPDGPRPGPHLFVRHERHRRHLPFAVARLAPLLENRRHVLRERHLVRRRGGGGRRPPDRRRQPDHSDPRDAREFPHPVPPAPAVRARYRTRTSTYAFVQQHWKPTAMVGPCGPESSHASTRST